VGYKLSLEGVVLQGGAFGVRCTGVDGNSSVSLVRSVISGMEVGIYTRACIVALGESWIGRGGGGAGAPLSSFRANRVALHFEDSDFAISNTVVWRNGEGSFGGVEIFDKPGRAKVPSYIVNSNFLHHEFPGPTQAGAIECNMALGDKLLILNSYFLNEGLGGSGQPKMHISPTCQAQNQALATNDDALAKTSMGVMVQNAMAGFINAAEGDFRVGPGAIGAVRTGGLGTRLVQQRDIVPKTDLRGKARAQQGNTTIGAFEAE
jgi:hypothetical protein